MQLLSGEAALRRVDDPAFQARWRALHTRCPWAGACQHPDFVAPWYRLYLPGILPVLVLAETGDGMLAGLLTLALRHGSRRLTGAGEHQAEYQAWLAPSGQGDAFMLAAVRALREAFTGADLCLRYLPPGIPLGWIDALGSERSLVALRPHLRPVMQVEAGAMARQRNKKNHRQNFNRLNRMGEVRFERVLAHDSFAALFDELCMQYDFRQAALYRQMPFTSDPCKKDFHLALHRQGLLHVTVLTVGGEVAASHFGLLSEGRALHIGILTHSPAHAMHSPGNLLLAMLGVQLAQEGVPVLDLTPGGDAYKEHFATGHDTVHELTVHGSAARRLAAQAVAGLRRQARGALQKTGYRGADLAAAFDALHPGWLGRVGRRVRARPCSLRYQWQAAAADMDGPALARNRLADVLRFDARHGPENRWQFMGTVMKRMERAQDLYTLTQDGSLVLSCWVQAAPVSSEKDALVLSDLMVHRQLDSEALLRRFVEQLVAQLRRDRPGAAVFYRGRLDPALRRSIEGCGFVADGLGAPQ
ncbi:GNAT family N-acetyltransferase [Massilia sp. IC2-476]|uniref:GNAT family N-acetyltransferase n=1 Tax=Massilia sp. IC2-476 TaxID=2887199 RepID=UPI001D0F8CC8|nr:GNAT family N-acetyltransferase [Massilia sp. IC2-476]